MTDQQTQQLALQIAVDQNRIKPGSFRTTLENARRWLSQAALERQSGATND